MRVLYKFVAAPGEEARVRAAAPRVPESPGGDLDAVHVFFRGSAVYVTATGGGDPWDALTRNPEARAFLDALRNHGDYAPGRAARHAIPFLRGVGLEASGRGPGDAPARGPALLPLPILRGEEAHARAAALALPADALRLRGAGGTALFLGHGELVLLTEDGDALGFTRDAFEGEAAGLADALNRFTGLDPDEPGRFLSVDVHHLPRGS